MDSPSHGLVNEYSTRYSVAIDAAQRTPPDAWREQSGVEPAGQRGAAARPRSAQTLSHDEEELQTHARQIYQQRLELGVAREQARKDLPLATYTEAYWKIDLHNLLHFLELRMDDHRPRPKFAAYANVIGHDIVAHWCPLAWEAFCDYRLHGQTFSRLEMALLREICGQRPEAASQLAASYGWLEASPKGPKRNRERDEFEEKLRAL